MFVLLSTRGCSCSLRHECPVSEARFFSTSHGGGCSVPPNGSSTHADSSIRRFLCCALAVRFSNFSSRRMTSLLPHYDVTGKASIPPCTRSLCTWTVQH
ncbi:hypothetical protein CDAR_7291 [Caerostris darwini]|uniref:Secreted protein n=1 Tax=Caerostris darwini TaxID=1538125 RepID=A0AAV4VMD5_9ARAC|nr:hypothetical protein CDAR_7291 [Caerostris darwini]